MSSMSEIPVVDLIVAKACSNTSSPRIMLQSFTLNKPRHTTVESQECQKLPWQDGVSMNDEGNAEELKVKIRCYADGECRGRTWTLVLRKNYSFVCAFQMPTSLDVFKNCLRLSTTTLEFTSAKLTRMYGDTSIFFWCCLMCRRWIVLRKASFKMRRYLLSAGFMASSIGPFIASSIVPVKFWQKFVKCFPFLKRRRGVSHFVYL